MAAQMFLSMLELSRDQSDPIISNQIDRLEESYLIHSYGFTCRYEFQLAFISAFITSLQEYLEKNQRKYLANDFVENLVDACSTHQWAKAEKLRESLVSLISLDMSI